MGPLRFLGESRFWSTCCFLCLGQQQTQSHEEPGGAAHGGCRRDPQPRHPHGVHLAELLAGAVGQPASTDVYATNLVNPYELT